MSTLIRGGTFYWFIGADTLQAVDSSTVSAAEVQGAWRRDALPVNETVYAQWSVTAAVPFRGMFRLHYSDENKPKAADVRFACLPALPVSSGPPPSISDVNVSPRRDLEPGDTVTVSFTTRSAVGLWVSVVDLPGGVPGRRVIAGNLSPQQTHTVHFEVGGSAKLGEAMEVTISTLDALLQGSSPVKTQTAPVYDRTAPTLYHSFTTGPTGRDQGLVGQYAPGDTIKLDVRARDNHRLAFAIYEFGAPANVRDSIAVPAGNWDRDILGRSVPVAIAVRPEWVGTKAMRVFARDIAGNTSEPRTAHPDSFRIYPQVHVSTERFTVPFRVTAAVLDPARKRVALLPRGQKEIRLFSLESMTSVGTVPLPGVPSGADFTPSGDSLIVALPAENAFAVVALTGAPASPSLIPLTVNPPLQQKPHDLRVMPEGRVLAVLRAEVGQEDEILELSLASGAQRLRAEFRSSIGNTRRYRLERSARRSVGALHNQYDACMYRYEPASSAFGPCRGRLVYSSYAPLSLSESGVALVDYILTDRDLNPARTLWTADRLFPGVISSSGEYVYLTQRRGIARVRTADGEYLERYSAPVPFWFSPQQVFITPDEDLLVMLIPLLETTEIVRVSRP